MKSAKIFNLKNIRLYGRSKGHIHAFCHPNTQEPQTESQILVAEPGV